MKKYIKYFLTKVKNIFKKIKMGGGMLYWKKCKILKYKKCCITK